MVTEPTIDFQLRFTVDGKEFGVQVSVSEWEWIRNSTSYQKAGLIGSRISDELARLLRPFDTSGPVRRRTE